MIKSVGKIVESFSNNYKERLGDYLYLWNILCVNTVYWIAHVLLSRYDEWEGEHAGGGDAVVQPEHPAVYVHVGDVE